MTLSTTNPATTPVVLPVQRSRQSASLLWAQVRHHAVRRLAFLDDADDVLQGFERLHHWKRPAQRHLSDGLSMTVSNCHSVLYTTTVQIGDQQSFQLQLDLEGTDLWVLSADCDESCQALSSKAYVATENSKPLFDNADDNVFVTGRRTGNVMTGTWLQDTVRLTDSVSIPHQGFAAVTHVEYVDVLEDSCWLEGGIGFGPTKEGLDEDDTGENYQTIRANLQSILPHPLFSLYLTDTDDYPLINGEGQTGTTPESASSELILGGVRGTHYTGCLNWHPLQSYTWAGDEANDTYLLWTLELSRVSVVQDGSNDLAVDLPNMDSAILVTDAMVGAANLEAVGLYASMNNLTCAAQVLTENLEIAYELVDCTDPQGFDIAFTDHCNDHQLLPLEIAAKNAHDDEATVYRLDNDVLWIEVPAEEVGLEGNDDVCLLGLIGVPGVDGLLLGEGFLRQYFAVFNFGDYTIGLAPQAEDNADFCPEDAPIDILNQPPSPAVVSTPAPSPSQISLSAWPSPMPMADVSSPEPSLQQETPFPTLADSAQLPDITLPPSARPHHSMVPPTDHHPVITPRPPYSAPYDSDNNDSNSSLIIPVVLVAAVLLGGSFIWRSRRVRYQRAAYFDDMAYRMGDMELREIY